MKKILCAVAFWVAATFSASAQQNTVPATPQGSLPFTPMRVINVTDPAYGARCNGSADDTAAFNAAIAAANATGHVQIAIPGDASHPSCQINGALTPISGGFVGIVGIGPYAAEIVQNTDAVDTLTWSATSPTTTQVFGGSLQNVWLHRTAATTSGAGLKLVMANGFFANNIDVREFYTNIALYGGSLINFSGVNSTTGQYFSSLVSGSSLVHMFATPFGSGNSWPSEVTFTAFDMKGNTDLFMDSALIIEGSDGLFFGTGHLGFGATSQVYLHPTINNVGIQSVIFSGVSLDGNNAGGKGIYAPALGVTGSFIHDIHYSGGNIEDLVGNGVDLEDPSIEMLINTSMRFIGGWAIYNSASSILNVSGNIVSTGFDVGSTGAIYNGAIGVASYHDLILKSITGSCLTQPTSIAASGPLRVSNLSTDLSCSSPPGTTLNYQINGVTQWGSGQGSLAGGQYSSAGAEGLAWGNSASASGYAALAVGDTATASGYHSKVFGYNVSDNNRFGAFAYGSGANSAQGDSQFTRTVFRGATSNTSAVRLTSDGLTARSGGNGGNCLNLWNFETAFLEIKVIATDTSTTGNDYQYYMPVARLAQFGSASTESYSAIGTAVMHSDGAGSTASASISADTSSGCLNVTFTPPSGNTDAWHAVALIDVVEAR